VPFFLHYYCLHVLHVYNLYYPVFWHFVG
jgi:hypothetical protein